MASINDPKKPMLSACNAPRPSTACPVSSQIACDAALYSRATPNQTKPTCSMASRRIFRLCASPQTTASHSSTAPATLSTAMTNTVHCGHARAEGAA